MKADIPVTILHNSGWNTIVTIGDFVVMSDKSVRKIRKISTDKTRVLVALGDLKVSWYKVDGTPKDTVPNQLFIDVQATAMSRMNAEAGKATQTGKSAFPPGGLEEAREVLFFASYCGEDTPDCTNAKPCAKCLANSNVYRIPAGTVVEYVRELAPERD